MRISAVQRILMVLAALLGSLLVESFTAATTAADAAVFAYDVPTISRVEVHEFDDASAGRAQFNGSWERSASSRAAARGTSTTPSVASNATNTADDVIGAVCSFSGQTEVLMADGTTKPISEIEVGDEVLAYHPETGERGPRKVTHQWVHQDTLVDLELGGSPVTTTQDHPFWSVTDQAWQPAMELGTDDLVLTADGRTVRVVGLDWSTAQVGTAYNLTVDDIHTYYVQVGSEEILVHNTCPGVGGLAGEFDVDELAQLTYQHVGAGDIAGRPSLLEIETALNRGTPVRLPGQNAVQFEYNGVRVIINEDLPTRSTAYYPGG